MTGWSPSLSRVCSLPCLLLNLSFWDDHVRSHHQVRDHQVRYFSLIGLCFLKPEWVNTKLFLKYVYIFDKSSLHTAKENICGSSAPSNSSNCLLALLFAPAPSIVSSELKIPDFYEDCDQGGVCHLLFCIPSPTCFIAFFIFYSISFSRIIIIIVIIINILIILNIVNRITIIICSENFWMPKK